MIFYIKVGSETQFLITINFYSLNMVFIYTVSERITLTILYYKIMKERKTLRKSKRKVSSSQWKRKKCEKHVRTNMRG